MEKEAGFGGWRVTRRDFLVASTAAGLATVASGRAYGAAEPVLRFGLVADCHYADREARDVRCYRDSLKKLSGCVQHMNDSGLDFFIELGDFKDQSGAPKAEETIGYLRAVEEVFCGFRGPRFHALGNHDMDSISKGQFLANVENSGISGERSYYSFDREGIHCTVLDANYLSDGSDYDRGNFKWTEPNVPAAELEWLEGDLAGAKGPVLVFVHQRLDGEGDVFVNNAAEVRGVLEEAGNVLAVFQGHHHSGDCTHVNGIHYYTLKAMVEGPGEEEGAYAIAELAASGDIVVTGYRRAVSKELARTNGAAAPGGR